MVTSYSYASSCHIWLTKNNYFFLSSSPSDIVTPTSYKRTPKTVRSKSAKDIGKSLPPSTVDQAFLMNCICSSFHAILLFYGGRSNRSTYYADMAILSFFNEYTRYRVSKDIASVMLICGKAILIGVECKGNKINGVVFRRSVVYVGQDSLRG